MLKKERQAYILHQVNLHNKVLSSSLCTEINVSEDTIRRDLQELADEGKVIKVHGGALSHSFNQVYFPTNGVYSQNQKKIIAQKAIALISNGMFVSDQWWHHYFGNGPVTSTSIKSNIYFRKHSGYP